jgi:hypothetical protein
LDCSKLDRLDFFAIEPLWLQAVRLPQPVLKFWSVMIIKWVVVCTDKKTKMCRFKESQQLASLKGGLSRGARVTQRSTLSAHVGVLQFVTTGKVSDEVQETENPETFPIQSDIIVESLSVGDEHDQQVAQSSTANFDSPQIAETVTMRELVDSLMDEHVQRVLEQVIDSDKEFSSKLGSDVLETCPQCNKQDDGSEVELLQHHQHSGFQEDRYCTALPLVLLHFFPQF